MNTAAEQFDDIDGVSLRLVASLETGGYDIEYMRDDLKERYVVKVLDEMYLDMVSQQVALDNIKNISGAGAFESTMITFEDRIFFLFPSSRYTALLVSFDRVDPFPVDAVHETARAVGHILNPTQTS